MAEDEFKASDRLFYAIAALKGWDEAAEEARSYGGNYAWRYGQLMSSILVAADEDREPIAVAGALDESGTGNLAVVYDRFVVVVDVVELSAQKGDVKVTVHGHDEIDVLRVRTNHNYFDGVKQSPRHSGIEFETEVASKRFVFPSTRFGRSPLVQGEAAWSAYRLIRDGRLARDDRDSGSAADPA